MKKIIVLIILTLFVFCSVGFSGNDEASEELDRIPPKASIAKSYICVK